MWGVDVSKLEQTPRIVLTTWSTSHGTAFRCTCCVCYPIQSWCNLKFIYTNKIITHRCYVTPATTVKDCKLGTSNLPAKKKSLNLILLIHVTGVKGKYWIASISCISTMVYRDLDYIKVYRIRAVIRGLDQEYGLIEVMGRRIFPINAGIRP